ncbi:MAG TPA: hypothetical protein VGF88_20355 [Acidobacteriaceae bacterium]
MGFLHRRMGRVLGLALTFVWVATLASAETAITPAMHCQGSRMPCCPRGSSGESCSTARCAEQIPEKAEAQATRAGEGETIAILPAGVEPGRAAGPQAVVELTAGLGYQASVFRLKDDLRI